MEEEAMEMRLNCETQQKVMSGLQAEQSDLSRQITQLQLAVQEKDSCIQYVDVCAFLYLDENIAEFADFI